MRKRWLRYCLVGLIFGVLDWHYLDLMAHFPWEKFSWSPIVAPVAALIEHVGWFLVAFLTTIYEAHGSRSIGRAMAVSIVVWTSALVGYYVYYMALLALWGLPPMEHLVLWGKHLPTFGHDWAVAFRRLIVKQFLEWMVVALVGGGLLGMFTGRLYLAWARRCRWLYEQTRLSLEHTSEERAATRHLIEL